MGSIYDPNAEHVATSEKSAEIVDKIDHVIAQKRIINILFVVDGTESMGPYFSAVANGIRQCVKTLPSRNEKNQFKFGGAIYRDRDEGDRKFELCELSGDAGKVVTFFDTSQAKDYYDTDEPEAVFYGLDQALLRAGMDTVETNLVLLIGDAGNHHRQDETTVPMSDVTNKLSKLTCHFLTFQVHRKADPCYIDFVNDAKEMLQFSAEGVDQRLRAQFRGQHDIDFGTPSIKSDGGNHTLVGGAFVGGVYGLTKIGAVLDPTILTARVSEAIGKIEEINNREIEGLKKLMGGGSLSSVVKQVQTAPTEPGPADEYTNSFSAGIFEALRLAHLGSKDLEFLRKEKYQLYIPAYATLIVKGQQYPLFRSVLLLNQEELSRVIISADDLDDATQTREAFQQYWITMLKTTLGKVSDQELRSKSLGDLWEMATGFPLNNKILARISPQCIVDPNCLQDSELAQITEEIHKKSIAIRNLFNSNNATDNYSFRSNEITYYWVDEEMFP